MSMQASGYTCPFCSFDGVMKILELHLTKGTPFATDLECPGCNYQWREFNDYGNTAHAL